jgi:hypothetical protein
MLLQAYHGAPRQQTMDAKRMTIPDPGVCPPLPRAGLLPGRSLGGWAWIDADGEHRASPRPRQEIREGVSSLVRNVPCLPSLEMSPF